MNKPSAGAPDKLPVPCIGIHYNIKYALKDEGSDSYII